MFGLALGGFVPQVAKVELETLVVPPEQRRPAGGGDAQAFDADGGLGREDELGGLGRGLGRSHAEGVFGTD